MSRPRPQIKKTILSYGLNFLERLFRALHNIEEYDWGYKGDTRSFDYSSE